MRRILHIIDSLNGSGAGYQLGVLANGLSREEFDQEIATLDATKPPLPLREGLGEGSLATAQVPITSLDRRPPVDPLAFLRLRRLLRHVQPDIIHTWNIDAALYSAAIGRESKRPELIIALDRIDPWKPAWRLAILKRWTARARHVVTNSASVRDWYVGKEFDRNRFTLIPPGVPTPRPSNVSREELLRELQLPPDAKLIGVVGPLAPETRVKDLIWAADLLRVLHDNLRVLIIGDGPLRSQLEEYARLASDLDHIRFLGERPDAWRIIPHLDVLWNGSENVGPSTSILESMAAGVPVVASDTPTNRELVVEDETGYLIPLGNRAGRAARARITDRVFSQNDLAARLCNASKRHAEAHFCVSKMLQSFNQLYCKAN